jgi:hypothetical protein
MDLEQLLSELGAESVVDIDYNAPEPGQFPPQVAPGTHDFIFTLPEDRSVAFGKVAIEGTDYMQVTHGADITVNGDAEPKHLNFLRVSDYKHPKMANSGVGDLLRCLDIKLAQPTRRDITTALVQADKTTRGRALVGWEKYCRDCQQIVSTNPRKRKAPKNNDASWPKDAAGNPELVVACPKCGSKSYGREVFVRYLLPEKSAS